MCEIAESETVPNVAVRAFAHFANAASERVAHEFSKLYKEAYKKRSPDCHYDCGRNRETEGVYMRRWWWDLKTAVVPLLQGKRPPLYPCFFDSKSGCWYKKVHDADLVDYDCCEGHLDLPCDAVFDESSGKWMHWVKQQGLVCAYCWAEHLETNEEIKTGEDVKKKWDEEYHRGSRQRADVFVQNVVEAIHEDPSKANDLMNATRREFKGHVASMHFESRALKTFCQVFAGESGVKLLKDVGEFHDLCQKVISCNSDRAEALERLHSKRYWCAFLDELSGSESEATKDALRQLREWDDVKVRYPNGKPLMELIWRHSWCIRPEKVPLQKWESIHGGRGRKSKGHYVPVLDSEGLQIVDYQDDKYCNRAWPSLKWIPSSLEKNKYYCPWEPCQGKFRFGVDGVCQVCVIHGNGDDAGMQWSMPCQQPHPLLLKHLDIANIPHLAEDD